MIEYKQQIINKILFNKGGWYKNQLPLLFHLKYINLCVNKYFYKHTVL